MTAKEIQHEFSVNVCKGFMLYCKDKGIAVNKLLNDPNKICRMTIWKVINNKQDSLHTIALCELAALLSLKSPSTLEQYYLKSINIAV